MHSEKMEVLFLQGTDNGEYFLLMRGIVLLYFEIFGKIKDSGLEVSHMYPMLKTAPVPIRLASIVT